MTPADVKRLVRAGPWDKLPWHKWNLGSDWAWLRVGSATMARLAGPVIHELRRSI